MRSFFDHFSVKKLYFFIPAPFLAMAVDLKQAILGFLIIIIIDLHTGIKASLYEKKKSTSIFKRYYWKSIHSQGLRNTWIKAQHYGMGIIVACVIEMVVLGDKLIYTIPFINKESFLTETVIFMGCAIEVLSIYENMEKYMKMNMIKKFYSLFPSRFQKFLKNE